MSDPKPEFVVRLEGRGLLYVLLVLSGLYAAWFLVVLYGEREGFGDDPGRWALLPTFAWAFIGMGLFAALIAYCLALLTVRELPGRSYQVEGDVANLGSAPPTPSFLKPQPESEPSTSGEPPKA